MNTAEQINLEKSKGFTKSYNAISEILWERKNGIRLVGINDYLRRKAVYASQKFDRCIQFGNTTRILAVGEAHFSMAALAKKAQVSRSTIRRDIAVICDVTGATLTTDSHVTLGGSILTYPDLKFQTKSKKFSQITPVQAEERYTEPKPALLKGNGIPNNSTADHSATFREDIEDLSSISSIKNDNEPPSKNTYPPTSEKLVGENLEFLNDLNRQFQWLRIKPSTYLEAVETYGLDLMRKNLSVVKNDLLLWSQLWGVGSLGEMTTLYKQRAAIRRMVVNKLRMCESKQELEEGLQAVTTMIRRENERQDVALDCKDVREYFTEFFQDSQIADDTHRLDKADQPVLKVCPQEIEVTAHPLLDDLSQFDISPRVEVKTTEKGKQLWYERIPHGEGLKAFKEKMTLGLYPSLVRKITSAKDREDLISKIKWDMTLRTQAIRLLDSEK